MTPKKPNIAKQHDHNMAQRHRYKQDEGHILPAYHRSITTPAMPFRNDTESSMFRSVSMNVDSENGHINRLQQSSSSTMDRAKTYPTTSRDNKQRNGASKSLTNETIDHRSSRKAINTNHKDTVWNVKHLRDVPVYYPLENSAIMLHPISVNALTKYITNYMKHHSISCVYHDDEGRIDCLTSNLLHFCVQLWNGGTKRRTIRSSLTSTSKQDGMTAKSSSRKPLSVIVEIQRRQGCCIEMLRLRTDLIHYLTYHCVRDTAGHSHHHNAAVASSMHPNHYLLHHHHHHARYYTSPPALLQQIVEQSTKRAGVPSLSAEEHENSLSICRSLLQSSQLDQNRLGLESLSMLVNIQKVVKSQAKYASTTVLLDPEFHSLLMKYFVNIEVSDPHCHASNHMRKLSLTQIISNIDELKNDDDDDDNETDQILDYAKGSYFGAMHVLALKVLSHAIDTMMYRKENDDPKDDDNMNKTVDLNLPFWTHVLQAVVYDIHISYRRPMEAALSIHCLRVLYTIMPNDIMNHPVLAIADTNDYYHHGQLSHMLLDARSYGQKHHSKLERETQQFMTQLGLAY